MKESIFFNYEDKIFCNKYLLVKTDGIYIGMNEGLSLDGFSAVFLHTKNDEFTDKKLRDFTLHNDYLYKKEEFEHLYREKCYYLKNEKIIDYLKKIDTSKYIKIYNKVKKTNKKNNSISVKKYKEYKFFLGFDTEFLSNIVYNARLNQIDDLNIERMNLAEKNDKIISYQFSMQITDELFLTTIIFPSETGFEFDFNEVIKKTVLSNMSLLFNNYKIYEDQLDITMIGHKNIVDFSKVKKFVNFTIKNDKLKLPSRLNGLKCVRNCFVTTKPIPISDITTSRHYKKIGNLHLRDSLLLDNPQSLRKLGESLNFKKLEIGEHIEDMENLRATNINAYIMYALQDSNIVVNFLYSLYADFLQEGKKVPLTIGSEGATHTRNFLKKEYNLNNDEFDKIFRGLDTYRNKKGKIQEFSNVLEPCMSMFAKNYFGGRNQTFVHGHIYGQFFDIDGSKFYPIMASSIPLLDFTNITYLSAGEVTENSFNWEKEEVGYALVDFEFTCDEKFIPCITQATRIANEDYGLLYTRKGKNVFTTLSELKSAYKLGCKIVIKQGIKFEEMFTGESKKYPFALLFKDLKAKRDKYKKGSAENKFWKLVMNSITGKLGQGLKHKKVYSYSTSEMDEITASKITSAPYISEITSLARTIITECMNIFIIEGYTVINVVTDGFLVQSPNNKIIDDEEINTIIKKYIGDKRFPSLNKWSKALERLGEKNYLEIKHSGTELLSIKTRVTALLNNQNESMSQFSATGYVLPPEWTNYSKNEQIIAFIELVTNRTSKIKQKGKKLVTGRDIRENKGTSAKMVNKNLSFNYDFKCKVIEQKEENNYILYKTTAWESIEEFRKEKRFRESNNDIQIINISGDKKMELLRELKEYNFRGIDKQNEFNDLTEKFMIMIAKTKIFAVAGADKELDYDLTKQILALKDIDLRIDKRAFSKLKLQKNIAENLDNLKFKMQIQLTKLFDEEKIRFYLAGKENNNIKYAQALNIAKEETKENRKKKTEKIEIHIAEQELKEIKFKS